MFFHFFVCLFCVIATSIVCSRCDEYTALALTAESCIAMADRFTGLGSKAPFGQVLLTMLKRGRVLEVPKFYGLCLDHDETCRRWPRPLSFAILLVEARPSSSSLPVRARVDSRPCFRFGRSRVKVIKGWSTALLLRGAKPIWYREHAPDVIYV